MNGCPADAVWTRLLADDPLPARPALEAHLGRCMACQAALERLTRDPAADRWRRLRAADSTATPAAPADTATDHPRVAAWPAVPGYAVEAEVGRGGMGVVYKARQVLLRRAVAVKTLYGGAAADALARLRAEAEAVARLCHPHIVGIHEVGTCADGSPFLCLEYLPGGTLAAHLDGAPVAAARAAALVEPLARAVEAAHRAGVVHRDLKPANVLLDADGTPKVGDFGLAKLADAAATQSLSGTAAGTPSYMAPEQARGTAGAAAPACDIYALGAILYECLTGRPPFRAESAYETVLQVVHRDPVPPRQLQPHVPRDLETVCLKCLHKEPGKRYATAAALADDLERFRAGRPVLARRTGYPERAWRFARRHPFGVGAAVLAQAALVAAIIAGTRYDAQLRQAKVVADAKANVVAGHRATTATLQVTARAALAAEARADARSRAALAALTRATADGPATVWVAALDGLRELTAGSDAPPHALRLAALRLTGDLHAALDQPAEATAAYRRAAAVGKALAAKKRAAADVRAAAAATAARLAALELATTPPTAADAARWLDHARACAAAAAQLGPASGEPPAVAALVVGLAVASLERAVALGGGPAADFEADDWTPLRAHPRFAAAAGRAAPASGGDR